MDMLEEDLGDEFEFSSLAMYCSLAMVGYFIVITRVIRRLP